MENIMTYYPQKDYYVGKQSRLPEVVVTGKKKKPYWVSPKGAGNMSLTAGEAMKGVDAAIGPLMNWVTPSRYVGAIRESSNPGEFAVNMLSGKYGVTTDEYAAKHPILSTLFNVGLDTTIPLATAGGFRAFKNYNASRLGKPVLNTPEIFPGQVGWAPKTTVSGYHASNEAVLNPNFWFNGWAQQRGAVPGFYFAVGEAPRGGFLAKRPYVHRVSAKFEKPMVQIGDIPTRPNPKNNMRNYIEQQARSLGADAIMYQDIRDNQLAHQFVAKTLNPDVRINVRQNLPKKIPNDTKQELRYFSNPEFSEIVDANIPHELRSPLPKVSQAQATTFQNERFVPKFIADVGPASKDFANLTIDRLKNLGYNTDFPIPIMENTETGLTRVLRTPSKVIKENADKPVHVGYYTDRSTSHGFYNQNSDVAVVDPTITKDVPSTMFHERVMHGTDNVLEGYKSIGQPKAINMYQDYLNKIFINSPRFNKDNNILRFQALEIPVTGAQQWYEARATLNTLTRRYLMQLKNQKGYKSINEVTPEEFNQFVDNLPDYILSRDLDAINGYGQTYNYLRGNSPTFFKDTRDILKYGAAVIPPLVVYGNKE